MVELWIALADLPAAGREFSFSDPDLWREGWAEYGMACRMAKPLTAEMRVLPQDKAFLVLGGMRGSVIMPCDRCAEDAEVAVESRFEEYEALAEEDDETADELVRSGPRGLELNLAGLLWEQFLLTLPMKPLCRADCQGLCPTCGRNLNEGRCGCREEEADPRLAALRALKLD